MSTENYIQIICFAIILWGWWTIGRQHDDSISNQTTDQQPCRNTE